MSDKEINPLKRGRIPNKSRGQKKSPSVGEISDPSSVLNDSISQGRVKNNSDFVEKTTTVDDPLFDPENQPAARKAPRNEQNRRNEHSNRSERPRRDSKPETQTNEISCACHKSMNAVKRWLHKIACYLGLKHECRKDQKGNKCAYGRKPDNRHHRRGNNSRRPRSPQR